MNRTAQRLFALLLACSVFLCPLTVSAEDGLGELPTSPESASEQQIEDLDSGGQADMDDLPPADGDGLDTPVATPDQAAPKMDVVPEPEKIPDEDADLVSSADELREWVDSQQLGGGTVTLRNSITLEEPIEVDAGGPVTIDTGAFGLVLDGGFLYGENFQIIGEGVDTPVVEVKSLGPMWFGDWNNLLRRLNVTANGRDGEGGTSLCISAPGAGELDGDDLLEEAPGQIRSYGNGAVGLLLAVPFDAYGLDVEVEGENATAVNAPLGGSLHFCRLISSGVSVNTDDSKLILDTCDASPSPTQDGISVYEASYSDFPIYVPVRQGEALSFRTLNREYSSVPLIVGESGSQLTSLIVQWDEEVFAGIDFAALGSTTIPGALLEDEYCDWFLSLLPESGFTASLIVDVRDPSIPCIYKVKIVTDEQGTGFAKLLMWNMEESLLEQRILWRSDDGGESWYDCTNVRLVRWESGLYQTVSIALDSITEGALFQVEVPGVGESNLVKFTFAHGYADGGHGGDRTGADRFPDRNPPDNSTDKPEDGGSPGVDGTPGGGDTDSGGGNGEPSPLPPNRPGDNAGSNPDVGETPGSGGDTPNHSGGNSGAQDLPIADTTDKTPPLVQPVAETQPDTISDGVPSPPPQPIGIRGEHPTQKAEPVMAELEVSMPLQEPLTQEITPAPPSEQIPSEPIPTGAADASPTRGTSPGPAIPIAAGVAGVLGVGYLFLRLRGRRRGL